MLLASLCLAIAPHARAAADIFLNLTGIPGESTAASHVGDIDVLSFQWAAQSNGTTSTAQDLVITKRVDKATPKLMLALFKGQAIASAILFVRNQNATPVEFLKITLTSATVSSINSSGSTTGGTSEQISLHFQQIRIDYIPLNPDGTPQATVGNFWNIISNSGG